MDFARLKCMDFPYFHELQQFLPGRFPGRSPNVFQKFLKTFTSILAGMPRGKYDDKELTRKALELRAMGYSYAQIASRLGASRSKIHSLIALSEDVGSRVRQVYQLAQMVDQLSTRLSQLDERLKHAEQPIGRDEFEHLKSEVMGLRSELRALGSRMGRLERDVAVLTRESREVRRALEWLEGVMGMGIVTGKVKVNLDKLLTEADPQGP